jgi:cystathionine beta-lyase/cystathionine gamma-synthase
VTRAAVFCFIITPFQEIIMAPTSVHGLATRAVRGGRRPDSATGAIVTSICQSTTFVQEALGKHKGFTYSRAANPTVAELEAAIAELEGTSGAVCFVSGMAAISTLFLALLQKGDEVIVSDVVYGGTFRLFQRVLEGLGVRGRFVDTSRPEAVVASINSRTRLILIESPANPTLKLTDIRQIADIGHSHGVPLAVDNTFLTPVLQPVFDLGADISVLSTTKYIEGHNATLGGSVATHDRALLERLALIRKTLGTIQSPFEAWLTLRGLSTLPLRLREQSANALTVARWLQNRPEISRVLYPGLESFPQRRLAAEQHRANGGIVTFEVLGGIETTRRLLSRVRLAALAENLGAVETIITHPATMTHADIPPAERQRLGISDGLVRLSVGLEDSADIIADLEQALAAISEGTPRLPSLSGRGAGGEAARSLTTERRQACARQS